MSDWTTDKQQLLTWLLNLASVLALMVGAWFFAGLADKLDQLNGQLSALSTQVALNTAQASRLEELRTDLRNHMQSSGHPVMVDRVLAISARVDALERGAR